MCFGHEPWVHRIICRTYEIWLAKLYVDVPVPYDPAPNRKGTHWVKRFASSVCNMNKGLIFMPIGSECLHTHAGMPNAPSHFLRSISSILLYFKNSWVYDDMISMSTIEFVEHLQNKSYVPPFLQWALSSYCHLCHCSGFFVSQDVQKYSDSETTTLGNRGTCAKWHWTTYQTNQPHNKSSIYSIWPHALKLLGISQHAQVHNHLSTARTPIQTR